MMRVVIFFLIFFLKFVEDRGSRSMFVIILMSNWLVKKDLGSCQEGDQVILDQQSRPNGDITHGAMISSIG